MSEARLQRSKDMIAAVKIAQATNSMSGNLPQSSSSFAQDDFVVRQHDQAMQAPPRPQNEGPAAIRQLRATSAAHDEFGLPAAPVGMQTPQRSEEQSSYLDMIRSSAHGFQPHSGVQPQHTGAAPAQPEQHTRQHEPGRAVRHPQLPSATSETPVSLHQSQPSAAPSSKQNLGLPPAGVYWDNGPGGQFAPGAPTNGAHRARPAPVPAAAQQQQQQYPPHLPHEFSAASLNYAPAGKADRPPATESAAAPGPETEENSTSLRAQLTQLLGHLEALSNQPEHVPPVERGGSAALRGDEAPTRTPGELEQLHGEEDARRKTAAATVAKLHRFDRLLNRQTSKAAIAAAATELTGDSSANSSGVWTAVARRPSLTKGDLILVVMLLEQQLLEKTESVESMEQVLGEAQGEMDQKSELIERLQLAAGGNGAPEQRSGIRGTSSVYLELARQARQTHQNSAAGHPAGPAARSRHASTRGRWDGGHDESSAMMPPNAQTELSSATLQQQMETEASSFPIVPVPAVQQHQQPMATPSGPLSADVGGMTGLLEDYASSPHHVTLPELDAALRSLPSSDPAGSQSKRASLQRVHRTWESQGSDEISCQQLAKFISLCTHQPPQARLEYAVATKANGGQLPSMLNRAKVRSVLAYSAELFSNMADAELDGMRRALDGMVARSFKGNGSDGQRLPYRRFVAFALRDREVMQCLGVIEDAAESSFGGELPLPLRWCYHSGIGYFTTMEGGGAKLTVWSVMALGGSVSGTPASIERTGSRFNRTASTASAAPTRQASAGPGSPSHRRCWPPAPSPTSF